MENIKSLILSSAIMSLFYIIVEFIGKGQESFTFGFIWAFIAAFFVFFVALFIFALPLEISLNKMGIQNKFHLLLYLIVSVLIHFLIYPLFNSHTPITENFELFLYAVVTPIIFWVSSSLFVGKYKD